MNSQEELLQFDLNTKKMKYLHHFMKGFGDYPGLILVDDELHIIGQIAGIHKYAIYNCKYGEITEKISPDKNFVFFQQSVTYLASKNIILIFDSKANKIHEYSLLNQNWGERWVDIPTRSAATVATSDDRYIIVIDDHGSDIFLYNVDEN